MWITIASVIAMKTVQMTLDEELVVAVDRAARELGTTRSAFTRQALRRALKELQINKLEEKQRLGYQRKPVQRGEFTDWENEQVWID
jgi:predicted transcriptional regulator